MLTDDDIKKLKGTFATKDDLKRFATKDDLKGFATKDDLKRFATKDDLKGFATKEDLAVGLFQVRQEAKTSIDNLAQKFDNKFDKVMETLDVVVGELKDFRMEQAAHFQQHEDIDADLKAIKAIPTIAHHLKN